MKVPLRVSLVVPFIHAQALVPPTLCQVLGSADAAEDTETRGSLGWRPALVRRRIQESSRGRVWRVPARWAPGQVRPRCPATGFGWFPVGLRGKNAGSFGRRLCFQKLTAVTAAWSWVGWRWGLQGTSEEAAETQESGDGDLTGDSFCAQPRALSRTSFFSQ